MSAEDSIVNNLKRSLETRDSDEKFFGVVTGKVINLADPMALGRVQVQLPFIDDLDLSPWARVVGPMAGMFHGTYFVPNPGDDVLVAFEQGDTNVPYIIGSLWNIMQQPPLPSPLPQVRAIRTLAGNQIVFTEAPPSVTIQTAPTPPEALPAPASPIGPHQTITMSPAGIEMVGSPTISLQAGDNSITLTPAGIMLQSGNSSLLLTPAGIFLQSGGSVINLLAGIVLIRGGQVHINEPA
jgi:hypothetical protein